MLTLRLEIRDVLTIAIQKSGRLSESSLELLTACGLAVPSGGGKLKAQVAGFAAEIFFLRDDDIPQYVADGVAHLGIVGENVVAEKGHPLDVLRPLGFGRCRLSLAVRKTVDYPGIHYFRGLRIATSYPRILQAWLDANQLTADLHEISGSVEIAPALGLADAIFDIVSSGSTLLMNDLKEVVTVQQSQAVLVATPKLSGEAQALAHELLFRIEAVQRARQTKYVLLNAPNDKLPEIIALLPGVKSPTLLPLAEPGWSSVHSVIEEASFWKVLSQLKAAGAQGILVIPLEKMVV